jgi:lipopolysaccharide export system protein LptC
MNRRTLFGIVVISLMGAGAMWLGQESEKHLPGRQQQASSGADYYITQFSATEMDEKGRPLHRLQADYMAHFVHNDTIEVTHPHATLFRPDEADWQLHANHALVEERGGILRLSGDVLARQPGYDGHALTEFRTDNLKVWPDKHYAETDDPVVITRPGSRIDAIGMRAHFDQEQLELRSAVRGYYEPQNQITQP